MGTKIQNNPDNYKQNYKDSLAAWLKSQDWTFFCTGTTRYELTLKSARRLAERFHDAVNEPGSRMYYGTEPFDAKEGHHIHFLYHVPGIPDQAMFDKLVNLWQWCTGNKVLFIYAGTNRVQWEKLTWNAINIRHYSKRGNAGGYCAKYVTKTDSDWDFYTYGDQLQSLCNVTDQDYCPAGERKRRDSIYHINRATLRSDPVRSGRRLYAGC